MRWCYDDHDDDDDDDDDGDDDDDNDESGEYFMERGGANGPTVAEQGTLHLYLMIALIMIMIMTEAKWKQMEAKWK